MKKTLPHIILFNPDQYRGDVLGHLGNPAARTPHLDQLVQKEAVSFSSTFCQNPVCTPSRCSFMTGWYPHVRGHRTMHHLLHPEHGEPVLLKTLKDKGYFVWWAGKNDLTPAPDGINACCDIRFSPKEDDFRRWNLTARIDHHVGDLSWRGDKDGDNFFSFYKGLLDKEDEEVFADQDWGYVLGAIDFLHRYDGDQPLCIYLPLIFPHPPYCVEEPWYSQIDRTALPRRTPSPADWSGKPSLLKGLAEKQKLHNWTEERWTELRAVYYGMCARIDAQFGRVTQALKDTGRYDDSAIFFFSDHGDFTGDYGLVEKTQNTFEDCLTHVPLVVKPPKNVPVSPRVSDALVELVDLSATVHALTGIDPGYDAFGKSLLPLIQGEIKTHRDAVFCEGGRLMGENQAKELQSYKPGDTTGLYMPRMQLQATDDVPYHGKGVMCRTATHKYVSRLYEQDELYDLDQDPREERNVVDDPAYAGILAELKARVLRWYMETCDVVPRKTDKR